MAATLAFKSCADSAGKIPGAILGGAGSATTDTLKNISAIFTEAFQLTPKVVQNNVVILQQSAPIAEFSVLKKEGAYSFSWIHTWMGSEKKIEVNGRYRAKAGFDLEEPFLVTLEKDGTLLADLPPAKLLSFEKVGDLEFKDSNGWFNRVTSEERSQVLNSFEKQAKAEMLESGILQEAEAQSLQRLKELSRRNGQDMVFRFRQNSLPSPQP